MDKSTLFVILHDQYMFMSDMASCDFVIELQKISFISRNHKQSGSAETNDLTALWCRMKTKTKRK